MGHGPFGNNTGTTTLTKKMNALHAPQVSREKKKKKTLRQQLSMISHRTKRQHRERTGLIIELGKR